MFSKILVLAPHTDDGELGVGGSIAKFIEEGKEIKAKMLELAQKTQQYQKQQQLPQTGDGYSQYFQ